MRVDGGSTPTNGLRICIGAFVFACASRRADRVVRPYGCVRVCIGARKFATLYRAGGAEPQICSLIANALHLKTYSPSPHPSAFGCHLPHMGKAFFCAPRKKSGGNCRLIFSCFLFLPRQDDQLRLIVRTQNLLFAFPLRRDQNADRLLASILANYSLECSSEFPAEIY